MPKTMSLEILQALTVHPFADAFPFISDEETLELAQDIEVNGLHHPIVLFQNEILDGRNRLRALAKTNLTSVPVLDFEGTEYEAVQYICSENIHRREMTTGQRAQAALKYLDYVPERHGGDRQSQEFQEGGSALLKGKTVDIVGEKFGIGGRRIADAKRLELTPLAREHDRYGEDLALAVRTGKMSLDAATKALKQREAKEQKRLADEAEARAAELEAAALEAERFARLAQSASDAAEDAEAQAQAARAAAEQAEKDAAEAQERAEALARKEKERRIGELIRTISQLDEMFRTHDLTDQDVLEFKHLDHTAAGKFRRVADSLDLIAAALEIGESE